MYLMGTMILLDLYVAELNCKGIGYCESRISETWTVGLIGTLGRWCHTSTVLLHSVLSLAKGQVLHIIGYYSWRNLQRSRFVDGCLSILAREICQGR